MRAPDTNVLLYSLNADCPEFPRAREVVVELGRADDVVICELVLVELYLLLRNRAVLRRPLPAAEAVEVCQGFRRNPRWLLAESAPVMEEVWERAAEPEVSRRRIVDTRLALTLLHHGVTELVTRNVADFEGFEFERVWDPFSEP